MRVWRHASDFCESASGAVLVVGNLDGCHPGHQALIADARRDANRFACKLLAISTTPADPILQERIFLAQLRQSGLDGALPRPSRGGNAAIARLCAVAARKVFVWGSPAEVGRCAALREMIVAWDRARIPVHCFAEDEGAASDARATEIRAALASSRPDEAARLLGRYWSATARIEHGDARGRTIGFPTANMRVQGCILPAFGTYAVRVTLPDGERLPGVANFGIRPTYRTAEPRLETYIFDFDGDLYGRRLTVEFVAWLRPERKFSGLDALIGQLKEDTSRARDVLEEVLAVHR